MNKIYHAVQLINLFIVSAFYIIFETFIKSLQLDNSVLMLSFRNTDILSFMARATIHLELMLGMMWGENQISLFSYVHIKLTHQHILGRPLSPILCNINFVINQSPYGCWLVFGFSTVFLFILPFLQISYFKILFIFIEEDQKLNSEPHAFQVGTVPLS